MFVCVCVHACYHNNTPTFSSVLLLRTPKSTVDTSFVLPTKGTCIVNQVAMCFI